MGSFAETFFNWQTMISLVFPVVVTLTTYYANDRLSVFLNKNREGEKVRKSAPSIYCSEARAFSKEKDGTSGLYSAALKVSPPDNGDISKEDCGYIFAKLGDEIPKDAYFIRYKNTSSHGVSLLAFYARGYGKVQIPSFPSKNIDPGDTVILFFDYPSLPKKVVAAYQDYEVTYSLTDIYNSTYIMAQEARKMKGHRQSKSLDK